MPPVIVISGGSSGIGAAIAERLLSKECELWNLDRVSATMPGIHDISCDLADPDSIDHAVNQLPDTVHGLINAAGVAPGRHQPESLMAVNFLGMRHLITETLPRVTDRGSVVIIASSAGRDWRDNENQVFSLLNTSDFAAGLDWLQEDHDTWRESAYKFSKQCAAAFTYRAAGLARDRQVRVNCINPGITLTPLTQDFRDMLGANRFDWIVEQTGRAAMPDDIAAIAEFLLIGDCNWLNGVEMTVDGGYYAGLTGGWITPPQ